MPWDREAWTQANISPDDWGADAETPTPEKERAVLDVMREIADRKPNALVSADVIRSRTYGNNGVHIAHAHWLADFLSDVGVSAPARELFRIEDAQKLAAPYEDYKATD